MVGRGFAFNYQCGMMDKDGLTAFERMFGYPLWFELFIPGDMVVFMPAPTIASAKTAKVESNLRAGIFLDYYVALGGTFTGQYICVTLENFVGKSLHRRADKKHYQLK